MGKFIEYGPSESYHRYGPPVSVWAAGEDTYYLEIKDHTIRIKKLCSLNLYT